jgi:preprotein translocase subunit SecD
MKRFMTRIIVCLVPTILSILIVAWAYNQFTHGKGGFRLGVDLAGGTILVYEVDETKLPENFKAEDLAAALKRRIDPADLYNITIRPVPGNPPRVEIILPTGGRYQAEAERSNWDAVLAAATAKFPVQGEDKPYAEVGINKKEALIEAIVKKAEAKEEAAAAWVEGQVGGSSTARRTLTGEEVENIKSLIARQGRLEFKILANYRDDEPAIKAAREWFDDAKNQAMLPTYEVRAEPPPQPRRSDGGTEFTAKPPGG